MPRRYVSPVDSNDLAVETRKVEFWKTYRGGQLSTFVDVPANWSADQIKDELDWCGFHLHNSEFMRYGWNDEVDFGSRT